MIYIYIVLIDTRSTPYSPNRFKSITTNTSCYSFFPSGYSTHPYTVIQPSLRFSEWGPEGRQTPPCFEEKLNITIDNFYEKWRLPTPLTLEPHTLCMLILLPAGTSYCSPCSLYGPTYRSSPHIPLEEVMWQTGEEVIQITSPGGYLDNLLGRSCEF